MQRGISPPRLFATPSPLRAATHGGSSVTWTRQTSSAMVSGSQWTTPPSHLNFKLLIIQLEFTRAR